MRALVSAGIQARAILEPLQSCSVDAPADEMRRILDQRGFDVAGVQQRPEGPVIGFVAAEKLAGGRVADHLIQLTAEHLVSDATPLAELFLVLKERSRVFVVVGSGVKGIVTLADLNKPPVRIYLFGLVSLLEMHLRYWVREEYPQGSWEKELSPKRIEAARKLEQERKTRNDQISLLDCLQFCDLGGLVSAVDGARARLNLGIKKDSERLLKAAEELRNRLAHSQNDLVEGTSWRELINLVEKIEAVVSSSDHAVEDRVRTSANDENPLWLVG
jgi:hypothetical protein